VEVEDQGDRPEMAGKKAKKKKMCIYIYKERERERDDNVESVLF